ncbi:hypothetical protein Pint_15461 [Pistacia integerrima]|uniref:Uncharacterized protein n=1 Tax=Pistacia integerrima TaxID=434235 RepID=A0ACC0ZCC6_9ROSI|nr:hypothetical protein Pint_15461 [Pistacia integerrima]
MNAISLKVAATSTWRCVLQGRESYSWVDLEYGRRRVGWVCKDVTRTCGVVACVGAGAGGGGEKLSSSSDSGGSSPSSLFSRSQTYALLKHQMEVAAKSEDYEEAARIRDSLKSFEEEEPVLRLRRLMKEAVVEERFEGDPPVALCNPQLGEIPATVKKNKATPAWRDNSMVPQLLWGLYEGLLKRIKAAKDAARCRDELKEIAPHSLLKCSSDATTLGIRVQVRSLYIEGRSQPSKGQYFFAYRVRITNNSDRPVQLLRRHWIITDANGKTENVWGIGVIGEQPVILPRTGFEYSSACPLSTSSGRMEGDFEMKHIDRVGSSTFNVAIAPFSLSTLGDGDSF